MKASFTLNNMFERLREIARLEYEQTNTPGEVVHDKESNGQSFTCVERRGDLTLTYVKNAYVCGIEERISSPRFKCEAVKTPSGQVLMSKGNPGRLHDLLDFMEEAILEQNAVADGVCFGDAPGAALSVSKMFK